jgi:hypothetical protein
MTGQLSGGLGFILAGQTELMHQNRDTACMESGLQALRHVQGVIKLGMQGRLL